MPMINGQAIFPHLESTAAEWKFHDFHLRQFNHWDFDAKASIIVLVKWRLPSDDVQPRTNTKDKATKHTHIFGILALSLCQLMAAETK